MSLYLSKLCLNPLFAPALKLVVDPYEIHRKLLNTLACNSHDKPRTESQPKNAELLFRVDSTEGGPVILIQTEQEPDWDALELAPRALRCPPQTKHFVPELATGQHLAFRLLCQPAVMKAGRFGVNPHGKRIRGPRRLLREDGERLHWLRRKGKDSGFMIETVGLTLDKWANTKRLQSKGGKPIESYDEARERAFRAGSNQRFGAVLFDGTLIVRDPEALRQAVRQGIGPGKAFGFGLLSLAKA